jgi:hypothetical protein
MAAVSPVAMDGYGLKRNDREVPSEVGPAIPEMREAPELPEPPSRIRVLHPSSNSLLSDDRL